jgi:hypothetical protein
MTLDDRQPSACPDDEHLAAYVEGRLMGAGGDVMERHVAACPQCLDVVAACAPARPAPLLQRASESATTGTRPLRASDGRRRWALAASIVLVAGALLLIAAERPIHGLGSGVSRLATRWLGAKVRVDAVAVRLGAPGTVVISLRDVGFGRADDLFRADQVDVTVALAALASGNSPVRQIRLLRPVVELARPEALAVAWSQDQRTRAFATLGDLDRIDVVDGLVLVRGTTLGVDGVTGGLERDAGVAKVVLQGRAGAGLVTVDGTLAAKPGRSAVTIAGRDVDAAWIPGLMHRLSGTAVVRIDVTASSDEVRVGGRVAVRNGRVLGRSPLQILGIDPGTAAVLSAAAPELSGDDVPFDEARAVFVGRKGSWRFPRVFVAAGDTVAGGRVRLEHGTLVGSGTVRVSARVAAALESRAPALAAYRDGAAATLPFVVTGTPEAPSFTLGKQP